MPICDSFMLKSRPMDELGFFSTLDKIFFLYLSSLIVPIIWSLLRINWYLTSRNIRVSRLSSLGLGFLLLLTLLISLLPL